MRARAAVFGLALSTLISCERPATGTPETPLHAILITIDTLRPDRLGAYGYGMASTPNLDVLASESIRFERAYSHSSLTVPSIATLLTSRLPAEHHLYDNGGRVRQNLPMLAARLHEAGFETAAFIGSYALRPKRGFSRGFDSYTKDYRTVEAVRRHPENLAEHITDDAIAWISRRDPARHIFLWVHYQEPHGAYTPPSFRAPADDSDGLVLKQNTTNSGRGGIQKYQWLGHGRLDEYDARYDGEIAEFDRHLGRLLDALDTSGILERSVVVLTSDHGEAFGEEDLYCAHGEGLGEALLHVPLVLRIPDQRPVVRTDTVRLIDVSRTVLEVLLVDASEFRGQSLLQNIGDRPVVAQVKREDEHWRSYRHGGYVVRQELGRHPFVFADPGVSTEGVKTLTKRLEHSLRQMAPWPRSIDLKQDPLSSEEREALRAMGYVE